MSHQRGATARAESAAAFRPKDRKRRDYSMFDAELSGQVLNLRLVGRLLKWMRPYRATFAVSTVMILVTSALQVLMPIIISLVVVDHVLMGESRHAAPDLGMVAAMEWLVATFSMHPLLAACVLYALAQL